jgi:hypothetical protein
MRNVSDTLYTENHNAFFVQNIFRNSCRLYEITRKNIVETDRPQMAIRRMRIACWIPKATNTHSECVILLAFPLQKWLHERFSVLRYMNITCFV